MAHCQEHSGIEERLTNLEGGMKFVNKMLFWLVTSSFATLASLVTALVLMLIKKEI